MFVIRQISNIGLYAVHILGNNFFFRTGTTEASFRTGTTEASFQFYSSGIQPVTNNVLNGNARGFTIEWAHFYNSAINVTRTNGFWI